MVLRDSRGVSFDGEPLDVVVNDLGKCSYHFIYDNKSYRVSVVQKNGGFLASVNGKSVAVEDVPRLKELMAKIGVQNMAADHSTELKAPMPGKILKVLTEKGENINKSQSLIVLEAMKMENVLKSPIGAQVSEINVKAGDTVEKDQILVTFENSK